MVNSRVVDVSDRSATSLFSCESSNTAQPNGLRNAAALSWAVAEVSGRGLVDTGVESPQPLLSSFAVEAADPRRPFSDCRLPLADAPIFKAPFLTIRQTR